MRTSDGRKVHELEQFLAAMLPEPFHHAPDVLSAFAGTDEQRVGGLHDNQIGNSYRGNELRRTGDEVSRCIEGEHAAGGNVRAGTFCQEFVQSGPGTDVAPIDCRGNDKDASMFWIARGGLEEGIIDGNV